MVVGLNKIGIVGNPKNKLLKLKIGVGVWLNFKVDGTEMRKNASK